MLTGKKIALFGFGIGTIGSLLYSGTAAISHSDTSVKKPDFDFDISKISEKPDYTTLVKAYKKVQRKYYPEKDIFKSII